MKNDQYNMKMITYVMMFVVADTIHGSGTKITISPSKYTFQTNSHNSTFTKIWFFYAKVYSHCIPHAFIPILKYLSCHILIKMSTMLWYVHNNFVKYLNLFHVWFRWYTLFLVLSVTFYTFNFCCRKTTVSHSTIKYQIKK